MGFLHYESHFEYVIYLTFIFFVFSQNLYTSLEFWEQVMPWNRNRNSACFIRLYSLGQFFPYLHTLDYGSMVCCAPFTSYVSQAMISISRIENVRGLFAFFVLFSQ